MKELLFATANPHKVKELSAMLPKDFIIKSLADIGWVEEIPETTGTIEGNAIQKANYLYQAKGIPCFAEDTGLEVEVLGGEPGVNSARYAGLERDDQRNMEKLLDKLRNQDNRAAQFKTVIAFVSSQGVVTFEGIIKGHILETAVGDQGFGYDPIFSPMDFNKSFAQLGLDVKSQISHRAKAFKKFLNYLTNIDQ